MIGIYRIINILNGDAYYGSSKQLERRLKTHERKLKKGNHENIHLQRAVNLYGIDNFKFEIVELVAPNSKEMLLEAEQRYIDTKQARYNISKTASGGYNINDHPNKEHILQNMLNSKIKMISKLTASERSKLWGSPKETNPAWKGGKTYCKCGNRKHHNRELCSKCTNYTGENHWWYGKKHTDETKLKQSDKRKGSYHGPIKVVVIDGIEYLGCREAARQLNLKYPTLRSRLNNKNYPNYYYK